MANPFTIMSSATRHMLDANVTFGMSSDRYNARDKYRRTYSDDQRLGAGIGTALGVALPVAAGVAWAQRGMTIPGISNQAAAVKQGLEKAAVVGMSPGLMQNVGRAAGVGALVVAAGVGVVKTAQIAKDDGDLRAPGAAAGVIGGAVAGAAIGKRFGGKIAAVSAGLGALAGGALGHVGGRQVKIGESQIGKEHAQGKEDDSYKLPLVDVKIDGAAGRATSFARGAFNHFNEVGPATQGISFGYQWGMRDAVANKYSNAERAGGMHGDLLAAGILGGGALAVAAGLMGKSPLAAEGVSNIKAGGDIAKQVLQKSGTMRASYLSASKGAIGLAAAAAAVGAFAGYKTYQSDKETYGSAAAATIGVGTLAATAATGAVFAKVAPFKAGTSVGARAASGMLVAAALIGVLSSARLPLQQFMNDAKAAHAANEGGGDPVVKWGSTGLGAAAGGLGAYKGLSKLVPAGGINLGKFHIPKGAVVAAGTVLGAGALGGIGLGLSATMPDAKKVGVAVAGGAVVGGTLALGMRGVPNMPGLGGLAGRAATGAVAGAVLGLSASSLLRADKPAAPAETTPQEVAGTVG